MLLCLLLEQQRMIESMLRLCNFGPLGVSAQRAAVVATILRQFCPTMVVLQF